MSKIVYGFTSSGIREKCSFNGVGCTRHGSHDLAKKTAAGEEGLSEQVFDENFGYVSAVDYARSLTDADAAENARLSEELQAKRESRKSMLAEDASIAARLAMTMDYKEQGELGGLPSALVISEKLSESYSEERELNAFERMDILDNGIKLIAGIESGAIPANDRLRSLAKSTREEVFAPENLDHEGNPSLPLKVEKFSSMYGGDYSHSGVPYSIIVLSDEVKRYAANSPKAVNAWNAKVAGQTGRDSQVVPPIKGIRALFNIRKK
jgi:hypothetical protein